ncbi:hypothetical protein BaRGS_00027058 [Batillaria attramentaria]|uniref:Uncharacterized protein n=1 Tax=Batillaria attramentaria TaxID=370345 RepID=A0ABD0K2N7_9CAEN
MIMSTILNIKGQPAINHTIHWISRPYRLLCDADVISHYTAKLQHQTFTCIHPASLHQYRKLADTKWRPDTQIQEVLFCFAQFVRKFHFVTSLEHFSLVWRDNASYRE